MSDKKSLRLGVICEAMEERVLMAADPAFGEIRLDLPTLKLFPGGAFGVVATPAHSVDFPGEQLAFGYSWTPYFGTVDFYLSADAVAGNGDDLLIASGTTIPLGQDGAGSAYGTGTLSQNVAPGTYHLVGKLSSGVTLLGAEVTVETIVPGVDLFAISDPAAEVTVGSTIAVGDVYSFGGEVWNRGSDASVATSAAIYLSTTPSLTASSIFMNNATVDAMTGHGGMSYVFGQNVSTAGFAPGTYYTIMVIDPDNVVAEYDETNNVLVGSRTVTITPPTVDLAVTDATWPTGEIWPELTTYPSTFDWMAPQKFLEAQFPLSVTVRSLGTSATFSLQLVLSKDDVAGNADDVVVGEMGLFNTDNGGTLGRYDGTMVLRFDGAPMGGTYRMILQTGLGTTDMTPGDNQLLGPMITVGGADLSLDALTASASTVEAGGSFTPAATAHVMALATAGVKVRYALSTDGVAGNADDIVLGTATVEAVDEGSVGWELPGEEVVPPSFVVPARTRTGVYRLVATVDPEGEWDEPNETNNTIVGPKVTVIAPEVRGTLVLAKTMVAGAAGQATLRLYNAGTTTVSRKYTLRLYLSADAALSADDQLFSTQSIGAVVGAGRTGEVRVGYKMPKKVVLGTRYLIAVAEVLGKPVGGKGLISTLVEASGRVTVLGPALRAAVRSVKRKPLATTVVVRVRNSGTYAFDGAATVTVRRATGTHGELAIITRRTTLKRGGFIDWVIVIKKKVVGDLEVLASY